MKDPNFLQMAIDLRKIKSEIALSDHTEETVEERAADRLAAHLLTDMEKEPDYANLHKMLKFIYTLGLINGKSLPK